ncbi:hypothetical protein QQ054_06920 [Oscillatoria amoena NRMC-F 0135]|nr:hypothetical protein [Oscillatoria amoena NRMC-F 0135]
MNKFLAAGFWASLAMLSLAMGASQINIGDSEIDVRNKMGKPSGTITIGKNEKILSYSQGDVVLKDGKVSRIEFLPGGKTFADLNKNSAEKLQKRIEFDKGAF